MKIENSHLLSNCNKISYINIKKVIFFNIKFRAVQEAKEQQRLKEQHREWVQRTLEENKRRIEEKKKNGR
jgi:hypothetical protein